MHGTLGPSATLIIHDILGSNEHQWLEFDYEPLLEAVIPLKIIEPWAYHSKFLVLIVSPSCHGIMISCCDIFEWFKIVGVFGQF